MSRRILLVTDQNPCASMTYGGQQRASQIARCLSQLGKVSLVLTCDNIPDLPSLDQAREQFESVRVVHVETLKDFSWRQRIRFEIDPSFLQTNFTGVSASDRHEIQRLIAEHDCVWIHALRTANEFAIFRWPHTVLDYDDVQSLIYGSMANGASPSVRKVLDYRMSRIWRRRERLLNERFETVVVSNQSDKKYLGDGSWIRVVPNGFAVPTAQPARLPTLPPRLGFIGTFQYSPNCDGVRWFVRRVWPRLKAAVPSVRLRLIGADAERVDLGAAPDVERLGFMPDPSDEIATWSAMIVPILSGGGTRIKIAEAFSRKCPIVSTSLGAHGYDVTSENELLLADAPEAFASACARLVQDPALGASLSNRAWEKFLKCWTWDVITERVFEAVEATCRNASHAGTDRLTAVSS